MVDSHAMTQPELPQASGSLQIRWSWIGYCGIIVGVASLGTLITVVTLHDIDALSTVALVLAVLAFAIQIMVFIAQSASTEAQSRSVQAVNGETRALLAELRGKAQDTNETVSMQFNKMLDGVLANVVGRGSLSGVDSIPIGEVKEAFQEARTSTAPSASSASASIDLKQEMSKYYRRKFEGLPEKSKEDLIRTAKGEENGVRTLVNRPSEFPDLAFFFDRRLVTLKPVVDKDANLDAFEISLTADAYSALRECGKLPRVDSE